MPQLFQAGIILFHLRVVLRCPDHIKPYAATVAMAGGFKSAHDERIENPGKALHNDPCFVFFLISYRVGIARNRYCAMPRGNCCYARD
jgi:hypothetical protein